MPSRGYRKPTAKRRNKRQEVLFTDAEFAQVQTAAEQSGMTVSAYLRSVAIGHRPKAKPNRVASDLVREMNRIGVNLHQLLRHANAGRMPGKDALEPALDELVTAVRKIM